MDPAFLKDIYAVAVAQQVFDGLVRFDANLNVIPCIAKSWEASRDGLVWTFHLRQGVKFHHGREVHADDFVYTYDRDSNRISKENVLNSSFDETYGYDLFNQLSDFSRANW